MANEKILLNAQAKGLGIEGYRQMTPEALKKAIATAQGKGSKPVAVKGKTNGAAPAKGKTATTSTAKVSPAVKKGKTASSAPAKSNTSTKGKSVSPKATAPKGAASRAKTPPKVSKGKATSAAAKAAAPKAKAPTKAKAQTAQQESARNDINLKKINWKLDCGVGKTGKRAIVLAALKEHKDYKLAFNAVKRYAVKWYPGKEKHAAERMVVWLVGRVAYDYAVATDQHVPGTRAAYGTSDRPQDVARRNRRAEANGTAKGKTKTTKTDKKATPAKGKATAPKPKAGNAAPAAKGKTAATKPAKGSGKAKGRAVKGKR